MKQESRMSEKKMNSLFCVASRLITCMILSLTSPQFTFAENSIRSPVLKESLSFSSMAAGKDMNLENDGGTVGMKEAPTS